MALDLSACLVHKGNGLPCLRLPEQDGAVGFHLPHQPCAGGQSGGPVPFLQQIVFLCAHADTGAVWLAIAKPYFPRYQCCSEMLAGNGFLATLSEVHLSPPKIAFGNIAKPGFLAQTCRQCCQKSPVDWRHWGQGISPAKWRFDIKMRCLRHQRSRIAGPLAVSPPPGGVFS